MRSVWLKSLRRKLLAFRIVSIVCFKTLTAWAQMVISAAAEALNETGSMTDRVCWQFSHFDEAELSDCNHFLLYS